jgi:hypothetical protein
MITLLKCDAETTGVTSKGPGTSERAGVEGFHFVSLLRGVGALDGIDRYKLAK